MEGSSAAKRAIFIPEDFGSPASSVPTRVLKGACHCGAVHFEVRTEAVPRITSCNCTFCRKKNSISLKVHETDIRIVSGREHLSLYQWHTRTAQHWFCARCGIYAFHRTRKRPDHFGVNAFCVAGLEVDPDRIEKLNGIGSP